MAHLPLPRDAFGVKARPAAGLVLAAILGRFSVGENAIWSVFGRCPEVLSVALSDR